MLLKKIHIEYTRDWCYIFFQIRIRGGRPVNNEIPLPTDHKKFYIKQIYNKRLMKGKNQYSLELVGFFRNRGCGFETSIKSNKLQKDIYRTFQTQQEAEQFILEINQEYKLGKFGEQYQFKCKKGTSIVQTHKEIVDKYWDFEKNTIDPNNVSYGSKKEVFWICDNKQECGCVHKYQMRISHKINGIECMYCSSPSKKVCLHKSFAYLYPQLVEEWDYSNNKDLVDPFDISPNSQTKVSWICSKDQTHKWEASIAKRANNRGCKFCKTRGKTQLKLFNELSKYFTNMTYEKSFQDCRNPQTNHLLYFDMYFETTRTAIELDGIQHFKQVMEWQSPDDTRKIDVYKTKYCLDNGISLIRILQTDLYDKKISIQTIIDAIEGLITPQVLYLTQSNIYEKHIDDLNTLSFQ